MILRRTDDARQRTKIREIGLRQILRERTHEAHVRLNHHPLLTDLAKPSCRREAYCLVLAAYFHFYRDVERAIDNFLAANDTGFSYGERRKLPWLEADLHFLAVNVDTPEFSPSVPIRPPDIQHVAELVGVLYTIEGATLGGQVISRHIASALGLSSFQGARFFSAYGGDTPDYWHRFLEFLESACRTPSHQESATNTAIAMFALIERLLDDYASRINA